MYFEDFRSKFTELPIACYVSHRDGRDMASGCWYKRHLHREFEALYLEAGDGVIFLNREPLPIHSGEVILIPPFVTQQAIDHLLEIIRACQEQPAGWTLPTRGHLMLMFALLSSRLQGSGAAAAPSDEAFCQRVNAYIARRYAENLTSRDVAAELCYSQSYFCRRFKRDFGLCFSEYLNAYRLNVARGLLLEKKRTVTEVAASVGFSSVSYFTRCFQRRFDMLPSDYCE